MFQNLYLLVFKVDVFKMLSKIVGIEKKRKNKISATNNLLSFFGESEIATISWNSGFRFILGSLSTSPFRSQACGGTRVWGCQLTLPSLKLKILPRKLRKL